MLEEFKFSLFRQKGLEQPKYMMETVDKQFRASVKVKCLLTLSRPINIHHLLKVGEDLFGSTVLEKNKKYAEQVFQTQHYSYSNIPLRYFHQNVLNAYLSAFLEQGAALVAVKCLNITEQSIVWKEKENTNNLEISNGAS